ncbi:hypothetical protein KI387_020890, partial [Taxus chinensis]
MQRVPANSHLFCSSCDEDLGFIRRNVNVAQFVYCDECVKAQKFEPNHAFLQTWDRDIFDERFADFSLEGSDGGILRSHKVVLAGKSKVFKAMLQAGFSESMNDKVKITDMTAAELRPFLNFLYTGGVNKKSLERHGVALYKASHKYDVPHLTAICVRFLEPNVFRDVRGVFELAVNYGVKKFQKPVLPYIFSEGFVESNPPLLVLKTMREAYNFECFAVYRKEKFREVSFLMELCLLRLADHLSVEGVVVERKNKVDVQNLRNHYNEVEDEDLLDDTENKVATKQRHVHD